jgi:hypothetical protein
VREHGRCAAGVRTDAVDIARPPAGRLSGTGGTRRLATAVLPAARPSRPPIIGGRRRDVLRKLMSSRVGPRVTTAKYAPEAPAVVMSSWPRLAPA